jgi:hypothetical protein
MIIGVDWQQQWGPLADDFTGGQRFHVYSSGRLANYSRATSIQEVLAVCQPLSRTAGKRDSLVRVFLPAFVKAANGFIRQYGQVGVC